jgi:hypothetical protein
MFKYFQGAGLVKHAAKGLFRELSVTLLHQIEAFSSWPRLDVAVDPLRIHT